MDEEGDEIACIILISMIYSLRIMEMRRWVAKSKPGNYTIKSKVRR